MAIQMLALKYFSLMLFALIMNLTPLISTVLGVTFLKERIDWGECILMSISFIAVVLVIVG